MTKPTEEVVMAMTKAVSSKLAMEAPEKLEIPVADILIPESSGGVTHSPVTETEVQETSEQENILSNETTDLTEITGKEEFLTTSAPMLPQQDDIGDYLKIRRVNKTSELTGTASITESTPTTLGLAHNVTGKILSVPIARTFNTVQSKDSETKTSRTVSTIAISSTATTVTTTIPTTTSIRAAIATQGRNTVTTTWIPTAQSKTILGTPSILSTLPSTVLQVDLEESTGKPSYPAKDTLVGSPMTVLPQDQGDEELEEHEEQDEKHEQEDHAWEKGTAGDEEDLTKHDKEILITVTEAVISELTSEAQEIPKIPEMESGKPVFSSVGTESIVIEMVGEDTTKWGNLLTNEPADSSESQDSEDETDTLATLFPSREEIIGCKIDIPTMEAGKDKASDDTGIAVTETPSITESATATAAIATKARNMVTKIWIQTAQTKTTSRTPSILSALPSVNFTHLHISDVNAALTETYVGKTNTEGANFIENRDWSSWAEEPEIASSLKPDHVIFPAVPLTTQAESVPDVPEPVTAYLELLTLQPDHRPGSTTGEINDKIYQFDTAVLPQVAVTIKPDLDMKILEISN